MSTSSTDIRGQAEESAKKLVMGSRTAGWGDPGPGRSTHGLGEGLCWAQRRGCRD